MYDAEPGRLERGDLEREREVLFPGEARADSLPPADVTRLFKNLWRRGDIPRGDEEVETHNFSF